jgi:hypothetical protein
MSERAKEDAWIAGLSIKDPAFDTKLRAVLLHMMAKIRMQEDPDDFHEDVRGMLTSESGDMRHAIKSASTIKQLPTRLQQIASGEFNPTFEYK